VIDFVKSIDAANGTPIVDGIGTQCHLTLNVAADESFDEQIEAFMALVEASLTELASTGKLVRITELDISLGTSNPARNQLQAQYEAYRRVFEAYKRIVPESQQSGITIWTLTDHADEHQYWLPDESPNLFDANGQRKWAYKGVCDGIAGEDLGLKYNGDDYKAWFEKNNTGNF
jgi:GH35 family endo-1,4-beta-xylanase